MTNHANEGEKVPTHIKKMLKGIKTEIMAGSARIPQDAEDKAWNSANLRAGTIIDMYIAGKGLFQCIETK